MSLLAWCNELFDLEHDVDREGFTEEEPSTDFTSSSSEAE